MAKILSARTIYHMIADLDWNGHVELPPVDIGWLATQLYVRLSKTDEEVCDACNKAAPIVLSTSLGNICAECIEDMNDNIDQMREALGDE